MALLEYVLEYGKVTCRVVAVEYGDRIRFTAEDPNAAIEYVDGTPFTAKDSPQADKPFLVGAGTTPEFTVTRFLSLNNKLHFNCGTVGGLTPWGTGSDTPSN